MPRRSSHLSSRGGAHPRGLPRRGLPPRPLLTPWGLLTLGALLAACGNGDPAPAATPGAQDEMVDPAEGIQFMVGIDRGAYRPGEPMRVRMQVLNILEEERTLAFRSAQRFDILLVTREGQEVSRWSEGRSFAQALGAEELHPGSEGRVWEETMDAPGQPGSYRLEAILTADGMDLRASVPVEVSGG